MGYPAITTRDKYLSFGEVRYLKTYLGNEVECSILNANFKGHKEIGNRYVEDIKVTFDDMQLAEKIYLNPIMIDPKTENPFKLKERNYPIDIAYPINETVIFKFVIPEGYQVVDMPENLVVKIPDGTANYRYVIEQKDNTIQLLSKLKLSKSVYSPTEYHGLKELFDKIIEKQAQQIVLKKDA